MNFFSDYDDIISQILKIDPLVYAQTRNHLDGTVSQLSPYMTHGVINTHLVAQLILKRLGEQLSVEDAFQHSEKYIFQLAWREFFHRVWQHHGDSIFSNLKHAQIERVSSHLPVAITNGDTGINVIDQAIQDLYTTGYVHNHARMWIASLVANLGETDWRCGAAWMHYHLLDGDLASNTLSWQWVAGTFSQKQYLANQENLDRFSSTRQADTWLDVSYETLAKMDVPEVFSERAEWISMPDINLTELDHLEGVTKVEEIELDRTQPLYLRSIYNLNPMWHTGEQQQVLLIEPEFIRRHPMSPQRWQFILHWAAQIPDLQVVLGSFEDLMNRCQLDSGKLFLQEHSVCAHWQGQIEPRPWLFRNMSGDYSSFYKFWNVIKKRVKNEGVAATLSLSDV